MSDPIEHAAQLAAARDALSIRGLKHAAVFACELYASLPESARENLPLTPEDRAPSDGLLFLAKSYFDLQEYARASHVLAQKESLSDVEFFVMHYARYLAGERRKEQLSLEMKANSGSAQKPTTNPNLKDLMRDLSDADAVGKLDAFGLYLYGVVLKESRVHLTPSGTSPQQIFWRSIARFPWNWSAWLEVSNMKAPILDKSVVCPWMADFFQAHVLLIQSQVPQAIDILERLKSTFPSSGYVVSQLARANYELRDFDGANDLFQQLTAADPYRMELMDLYSDVLYVREDKTALSELAHHVQAVDKYCPETNCVIGNYYALKGQHERAIAYFTRAISLDNECLAAWTLIGHEYIQMKNTNAAIEVYRRALELAQNDYRAWYGLGQAYELLDLYHYSIYYYQKAAAIRPYDARMWVALGGSFEKLGQMNQAKVCYLRAVGNKDAEGIAVFRLAKLYEVSEKDMDKAAEYYRMHWRDRTLRGVTRVDTTDAVQAVLFLGKFCMQRGELPEAMQWCNKLLERDGPEKEEAKAMLHAMRQMEFSTPETRHTGRNYF
ncbi:Aste57867_24743 [Aphanomyces stellatus]|uniref:Aste57867_24743 protein n=1 Tax=Aphanomyces stellatus TaxID=120398 RepID=A0A485LRC5_9STRA|nr:hypothetical protein As57867_024665 [Aphanomyces stellatus]VFU01379.1 Aste57867_24743 [Aphanomyces stellatus]